jgi:hypothetical protein
MLTMNLPCEIVRDLLPSYADGLTCETTNEALREHLEGCAACREALAAMRAPEAAPLPEPDRKELDFLKKTRKRTRRIILTSLLGVLALVFGLLALRVFVVGREVSADAVAARAEVDGRQVTLTAVPVDGAAAVTNIAFREDNGVVTATVRTGLVSFLHRGDAREVYEAAGEVKTVKLDGRILWQDGQQISARAAKLYETRHDYVGDASANIRSAGVAGVPEKLGPYTSVLDTESAPYVWHIRLESGVRADELADRQAEMRRIGCALLAVVGNLDEVRFEYAVTTVSAGTTTLTMNGEGELLSAYSAPAEQSDLSVAVTVGEETFSVTAAEATAFLGRDVKDCLNDVCLLDKLLRKAELG